MKKSDSRLVYSTDRAVPRKEKSNKRTKVHTSLDPSSQKVTVRHERKGRGGKSVTVIEGIQLDHQDLKSLLRKLKSKFGTGGAVQSNNIEIQGEHCDSIISELKVMGYRPKRSGG